MIVLLCIHSQVYGIRSGVSHMKISASPFDKSQQLANGVVKFETTKGTNVYVRVQSITTMKVDCIITSTNLWMNRECGVSKVIADEAGEIYRGKCRDYIKKYGRLTDESVVHTEAGKLAPIKYVVHVVIPKMAKDEMLEPYLTDCVKILTMCFFKAFMCADKLECSTVAVPLLSAGI